MEDCSQRLFASNAQLYLTVRSTREHKCTFSNVCVHDVDATPGICFVLDHILKCTLVATFGFDTNDDNTRTALIGRNDLET